MADCNSQAWVTLATNDSYCLGALVLAHSLRRVGTTRRLAVLVTRGITESMMDQLRNTFDEVRFVDILDSGDSTNLRLLSRPDLGITFTKLHCWRLTQYTKCVFLDADTLVLQPCDELFDREELSAAPDPGWPDCFNSGVFVYKPSEETYERLISLALSSGSFDGGDQGLLNTFFSDWATKDIGKHLSFLYNMCAPSHYSYLPAFKQFGEGLKIAHFIGPNKPWSQYFDSETRQVRPSRGAEHLRYLLQFWWDLFCSNVHPTLTGHMSNRLLVILPQLSPYTSDVFNLSDTISPSSSFLPTPHEQEIVLYTQEHFYKSIKPIKPPDPPPEIPEYKHPSHHDTYEENVVEVPQIEETQIFYNSDRIETSVLTTESQGLDIGRVETSVTQESQVLDNKRLETYETSQVFQTIEISVPLSPRLESPPQQQPQIDNSSDNSPFVHSHKEKDSYSKPCPNTPPAAVHEQQEYDNEEAGMERDGGLASAFAQMTLGAPPPAATIELQEHLQRAAWEQGNVDYMGADSFDNIWRKILDTISKGPSE